MHEHFKRTYTKEEAEELVRWIDKFKPEGELDLGHGVCIKELKVFSQQVRHVAVEKYSSPTFAGQISLMMDVRDLLSQSAG